jgi:hypothetical protein
LVHEYAGEIARSITSKIHEYVTYYNVHPLHGVDEFKLIYFTGQTLMRFLAREALVQKDEVDKSAYLLASQVTMYGAVFMLDHKLKACTDGIGRPALKRRLARIIKDRNLDDRLGDEGAYLIYKIAYNLRRESTEWPA